MNSTMKGWFSFLRHHLRYANQKLGHLKNSDPEVYEVIKNLNINGYHKISGYWDEQKVLGWELKLDAMYAKKNTTSKAKLAGQRWQDIQNDFPDIVNDYVCDSLLQEVAKNYIGVDSFRKITYQHSFPSSGLDEDQVRTAIKDGSYASNIGLGQYWHFDSWDHGLKAVLYLSDVNEENGPFRAVPGSHRLNLFSKEGRARLNKCAKVLPPHNFDSNELYYSGEEEDRFKFKKRSVSATGRKGTLYLIDPFLIHRADIPMQGIRKVLWIYYW
jgi:hypothetical protein